MYNFYGKVYVLEINYCKDCYWEYINIYWFYIIYSTCDFIIFV